MPRKKRREKGKKQTRARKKGNQGEQVKETQNEEVEAQKLLFDKEESEEAARRIMIDMGFHVGDINTALEHTEFAFGKALLLLLNGLDAQRTKYDTKERFRRHGLKTVKGMPRVTEQGKKQAEIQYIERAQEICHLAVTVLDFGQYAGRTAGACFWLCLAAGVAECNGDVLAQALPGDHPAIALLAEVRGLGLAECIKTGVRNSPLGLCAAALRDHFCSGPKAVLLRESIRAKIYPAFAHIVLNGPARTDTLYQRWVDKLASKEYADELVLVAVAMELSIRLVVIPYTPPSAVAPWTIPTYGATDVPQDGSKTIYLGNNDVHYVYLCREAK